MRHFNAHYSGRHFGTRFYDKNYNNIIYFLGIDAGTSSVKSLLLNGGGRVIDIARSKYGVIRGDNNQAEQDISEIWRACCDTLNELNKNNRGVMRNVKAVGLSGQMHGLVTLDKNNNPLRNAIIWEDQRSSSQINKIYDLIGSREDFCNLTLNQLSTGYLITSLMWLKEKEPEIFENINKIMFVKDYIRFKLCGEIGTDVTDGSGSMIFETAKREWAWRFIKKLDLPEDIFPPCYEPYETAGEVTHEAAKITGLKAGTPVVFGGGDTLMSAVGTGLMNNKNKKFWGANIGTGCQVICALDQPLYDKNFKANTFCYISNKNAGNNENLWMLMGANLCGGAAMRWFSRHILNNISFEELDKMSRKVPAGSENLIFLPFLSGARNISFENFNFNDENNENNENNKNKNIRGIFAGLSLNHDKSHMARSILEGVIFSMRDSCDLLKNITGEEPDGIIASGGGAVSDLTLQLEANIFNKPIYKTLKPEEACIGAALAAAVGVGFYKSFDEACGAVVKFSDKIIEPDIDAANFYNDRFAAYKELYRRNFENF